MQRQDINTIALTNLLTREILLTIFSYLSPRELAVIAEISTFFKALSRYEPFWQQKFAMHFPHLLDQLPQPLNKSWFDTFAETYSIEYQAIPKKYISFIQEANEGHLSINTIIKQLTREDEYNTHLLSYIVNKKTLDHLYQFVSEQYRLNAKNPSKAYENLCQLDWAILCRQPLTSITALLSNGRIPKPHAKSKVSAFHYAAQVGDTNLIFYLNRSGNSIEIRDKFNATPLMHAIIRGQLEATRIFVYISYTFFMDSMIRKSPLKFGKLLNHMFITNKESVAHVAVIFNRSAILKLFIEKTEAMNNRVIAITDSLVNALDNLDQTPLHFAAKLGRLEIAKLLLGKKANKNNVTADKEYSPLHLAIIHNKVDLVRLLTLKGSDLYQPTKKGYTAFDLAKKSKNPLLLQILNHTDESSQNTAKPNTKP